MTATFQFDRLLSCLLATLLVTAGVPAMAASSGSSASSPTVTFTDDLTTEQRGDVVEIGVRFSDAEVATVRIGSETNHVATVVVRDEDGDGSATVRLNTYDGTITASEGDATTVEERSSIETPLAAGTYDLDLWMGSGTDGKWLAVGNLALEERSTHDLRTWVASPPTDLTDPSTIDAAKASGNLTQSDTVTENDTLVLELRTSGLEGPLAAQNASNATAAFFSLFGSETADMRLEQFNPSPNLDTAEIHLTEYDSTRAVADPENDSYYLVADLSEANVTRDTRDAEIRAGHEYRANFSVLESSGLVANETESVAAEFAVVERLADLLTAEYKREFATPAPNQTVTGRTTLPPGTAVTVELRSAGGDDRFSKTVRVRNGSDGVGRFQTVLDFSDVANGTNLRADVRSKAYPGLDFETAHVIVSELSARAEIATVAENGVSLDAKLSHGGFVAVRRGSADGEVIGHSGYLDADTSENPYVSVNPDLESNVTLVAVAYRDADRDGEFDPEVDEPYETEGSIVADATEFTVEGTTTANGSTRATTDAPMPDETTGMPVGETAKPINDRPVPGFGPGASVVALLVGLLLARRR